MRLDLRISICRVWPVSNIQYDIIAAFMNWHAQFRKKLEKLSKASLGHHSMSARAWLQGYLFVQGRMIWVRFESYLNSLQSYDRLTDHGLYDITALQNFIWVARLLQPNNVWSQECWQMEPGCQVHDENSNTETAALNTERPELPKTEYTAQARVSIQHAQHFAAHVGLYK